MEIAKMLSGVRPSNTHRDSSGKIGYNLTTKRSTKSQQNSKKVKESGLPTQAKQSLRHQEILKAKRCIHKSYGDLPHELREQAHDGNIVKRKTSENSQQLAVMLKTTKDDELVRYMSNLPAYLQRVERTDNMRDKAFNVGVLDWGRLENWKCNQKGASSEVGKKSSWPCSNLSAQITTSPSVFYSPTRNGYENKKHHPNSGKNNSHNGGTSRNAKSSIQDSRLFQDLENYSMSHVDEEKRAVWKYRSFDKNSSDTTAGKGKRREMGHKITSKVEHQPSNSKCDRVPIGSKETASAYAREVKQGVQKLQASDIKRKTSNRNFAPGMGTSSSESRNYDSSAVIKEKKNVDSSGTKKKLESQELAFDPPCQHKIDEKKNSVPIVPKKLSQNSSQMQPRMSLDEDVTDSNQNFLSDGFSDKVAFSSELHHEIPHSCPLPSAVEKVPDQNEMGPDAINSHNAGVSSSAINESARGNVDEISKKLERETAELAAKKSRHPSPSRRFSFSLSRMTRSFSFKESSAVPQLSPTYVSVKSGPVTYSSFASVDASNREKASNHNGARSSPLRRILDPLLLKSKGIASFSSAETYRPLGRSLSSYNFKPRNAAESLGNEKHEASSSLQAQLVLTTSNGLPLFRFVINNNIIVAAPLKNLVPPGNNVAGCNYVVYSIDEYKRRSGRWINQVGKEKRCGFVYNLIGQMKVNSSASLDFSENNFNGQHVVKESVLYGVELRQEQASPKLMPNAELAAIVFKMPNEILGFDMQHLDRKANVKEKGSSCGVPEHDQDNSCTVILPGGIHSLPKTGIPSPLIHRWRSGGSCDCGGWDIGCKLCILSDKNRHQKLSRKSDCFELFAQGQAQQDRPIFSMTPYEKGSYSVEFSPSISLLQASFICVSVISCQRLPDLPKVSENSDEKALLGSSNTKDGLKTKCTTVLKETPVKYIPCPPVSPVGRA